MREVISYVNRLPCFSKHSRQKRFSKMTSHRNVDSYRNNEIQWNASRLFRSAASDIYQSPKRGKFLWNRFASPRWNPTSLRFASWQNFEWCLASPRFVGPKNRLASEFSWWNSRTEISILHQFSWHGVQTLRTSSLWRWSSNAFILNLLKFSERQDVKK